MKDDSKSRLKVNYAIGICIMLVLMSSSVQLINLCKENIQVAQKNNVEVQNNNQFEGMQLAERTSEVASRSGEERIIEQEVLQEPKYISIKEITISKDMDLTKNTGVSKEDFKELMTNLKVDSTGFFEKNSDTIYDLCHKYEVNEIFFCGLIAAESGWNISSNHRNTCNYISMMSGGKLIRYSSTEEGLEAAVKLLHNKYLTKGGSCYYGTTISCVQKRFCPNSSTWVNLVYGCMKQVLK